LLELGETAAAELSASTVVAGIPAGHAHSFRGLLPAGGPVYLPAAVVMGGAAASVTGVFHPSPAGRAEPQLANFLLRVSGQQQLNQEVKIYYYIKKRTKL